MMKKIFFLLSFLVCAIAALCQYPVTQSPYGDSVLLNAKGATKSRLITNTFADTAHANLEQIRTYAGAIIKTINPDAIWYRNNTATMWVLTSFAASAGRNCGNTNGFHLVSYDSALTFDVTSGPYVTCCDGVARFTPNTSITLDTNSTGFPRYDLIILDRNGVNKVKGTPSANPNTPTPSDSCAIVLSYVLINAHSSVPAFVSSANPFIIYDENYSTEFFNNASVLITVDTANLITPLHLTHSMLLSSWSPGNYVEMADTLTSLDLNNYSILKFYVNRTSSTPMNITFTFFFNAIQVTLPGTFTIPVASGYTTFVAPLTSFTVIGGTLFNRVRISVGGTTATAHVDWIQLQSGIPIVNTVTNITQGGSGTLTGFTAGNLPDLFNTAVANSSVSPILTFTKTNACAFCVYQNDNSTPNAPLFDTLDITHVIGQLPYSNITTLCSGCYLANIGSGNAAVPIISDSIFVKSPLKVVVAGNNDTLSCPTCSVGGQTLQQTFNTEVGGSVLTKIDSIQNGSNYIYSNGSGTYVIKVNNSTANYGVYSQISGAGTGVAGLSGSGGVGINGFSSGSGNAILGTMSSGTGTAVVGNATGGLGGQFFSSSSGTNDQIPVLQISRGSTGTPAPGLGVALDMFVQDRPSTAALIAGRILTKWTDTTNATRTAQSEIWVTNSASITEIASFAGAGVVGIGNFSSYNSTRLDVVDNGVAGNSIVNISTTSTAAASNAQKALNISLSGANSTSTQTTTGIVVNNNHSGTGNVNIGISSTVTNDGNAGSFAILGVSSAANAISGQSTSGAGGQFSSNSGVGINVSSSSNYSIFGSSTSGKGIGMSTTGNISGEFIRTGASDAIIEVVRVQASRSGGGAGAGFGPQISLDAHNSANSVVVAGTITADWTSSTAGSEISEMTFGTNNAGTFTSRLRITGKGSILTAVNGAIATNATDGFLYIPTCAGTPTGVPTTQTGMQAMVWDATNHKLYVYDGSWLPMN